MRLLNMKTSLVLVVAVAAVAAQAFVPRGAFIRRPVKNVADLIAHTQSDPVVMERYVRHFRLTPPQVVAYFNTLHMAKLARSGFYNVYNIHEDNVIRMKVLQLKAGTKVFADANGRPILQHICGNPMVFEIPRLGPNVDVTAPVEARDLMEGDGEPVESEVIVEPTVSPVVEPPINVTPPVEIATGRRDNYLGLLLLAGGAAAILTRNDDDPKPVPEPATLLVMSGGAAAFLAKRRKKS